MTLRNTFGESATIRRVSETGEWKVTFRDFRGKIVQDATYYTDSLEDAKATAMAELERAGKLEGED